MKLETLILGAALAVGLGATAQAGAALSGNVTYYNAFSENAGVGITFSDPFLTDSFTAISDTADYGGSNSDPSWPGGGYSAPSGTYGFGADFLGDITVPTAGKYTFDFGADDAAYLFVNGGATAVADFVGGNDLSGSGAPKPVTLTLSAGANPFEIQYANEISDQAAIVFQPVPEPAVWAMMLVGFGAVGGALRTTRRKNGAVAAAA
ncbi:MAG TPA: PEPxxWA-CTERM sorting domain-containing protein [Caulobacteraceae bacterium]|nr:PEPxxWA-CTERM sorting domain-containing protein [Caulobacteraceae bacterium]